MENSIDIPSLLIGVFIGILGTLFYVLRSLKQEDPSIDEFNRPKHIYRNEDDNGWESIPTDHNDFITGKIHK